MKHQSKFHFSHFSSFGWNSLIVVIFIEIIISVTDVYAQVEKSLDF